MIAFFVDNICKNKFTFLKTVFMLYIFWLPLLLHNYKGIFVQLSWNSPNYIPCCNEFPINNQTL